MTQISKLKQQIEIMKCCSNCKNEIIDYDIENEFAFNNCKYKDKCKYYAFDLDNKLKSYWELMEE